MKDADNTELGTVRIHKNVISSIARHSALEIDGVARIHEPNCRLCESLGIKPRSGLRVDIDKNNEVRITISLIIKYGHHLSDVSNKVQDNVRKAIERMTDLNLREVNVDIKGMDTSVEL